MNYFYRTKQQSAFTIVELFIIIVVIGILASVAIVGYGLWQRRTATTAVTSDLSLAISSLKSYENFKNDFPPNMAGTSFVPSPHVAMTLYTNAPQTRVYSGLTPAQNAQLFLNSCNASMPVTSGSTTYNTSCAFAGDSIHVKGTSGSNVILTGPTLSQSDIVLTCGAPCDAAETTMINGFLTQGGSFPITVPKSQVSLPEPSNTTYGAATEFCLEVRSVAFSDIIYHSTNQALEAVTGQCPDDPTLHYP